MGRRTVDQRSAYLAALHAAPEFVGVREFHRRFARHLGHERTLARWRRSFRLTLRAFPSFTVETLGLSHLHLVVTNPDPRWERFPYAVELLWGTPDLTVRALYLHCLVPSQHLQAVLELVEDLRAQGWCSRVAAFPSLSGWQHLQGCDHQSMAAEARPFTEAVLLARHPLIVPVVVESWNRDATLPGLWDVIRRRLGPDVRHYLPRQRLLAVNGKRHVGAVCRALSTGGLFRQHIIRDTRASPHELEVLIVGAAQADCILELLAGLRPLASVVETYWTGDRCILARIAGPASVLDLLLELVPGSAAAPVVLMIDRKLSSRSAASRFCYEFLFDPKAGAWVFPRDRIMEHLGSR